MAVHPFCVVFSILIANIYIEGATGLSETFVLPRGLLQQAITLVTPGQRQLLKKCLTDNRSSSEQCFNEDGTLETDQFKWLNEDHSLGQQIQEFLSRVGFCVSKQDTEECPVSGGWGSWSQWSGCSKSCGLGVRLRNRSCVSPEPMNGGLSCGGEKQQGLECHGICYPVFETAVMKSARLYMKKIIKTVPDIQALCIERKCVYDEIKALLPKEAAGRFWTALHCALHGRGCPSENTSEGCDMESGYCVGGWSLWSAWSSCSSSCGRGQRMRDRTCSDPRPTDGTCEGSGDEVEKCFSKPCDGGGIGRQFTPESYLKYSASGVATHVLTIKLRVFLTKPGGLLWHRYHKDCSQHSDCDISIGLTLNGTTPSLFVKLFDETVSVQSSHYLQLGVWHDIVVEIVDHLVSLNANSVATRTTALPDVITPNLDTDMILGKSEVLNSLGFRGVVRNMTVNYHSVNLWKQDNLRDYNVPVDIYNVGNVYLDKEASMIEYDGNSYTNLSASLLLYPGNRKLIQASIDIVMYPHMQNGLLLYTVGTTPGSFILLSLKDRSLTLCVQYGPVKCSQEGEIQIHKWQVVTLLVRKSNIVVRVDQNHATQVEVMSPQLMISPHSTIYVGGVPSQLRHLLSQVVGLPTSTNYVGLISSMQLNYNNVLFENVLVVTDNNIRGMMMEGPAIFTELNEPADSVIELRCIHPEGENDDNKGITGHKPQVDVIWIKDHQLITYNRLVNHHITSSGVDVLTLLPSSSRTRTWTRTGFYSCVQQSLGGRRHKVVQAFVLTHDDRRLAKEPRYRRESEFNSPRHNRKQLPKSVRVEKSIPGLLSAAAQPDQRVMVRKLLVRKHEGKRDLRLDSRELPRIIEEAAREDIDEELETGLTTTVIIAICLVSMLAAGCLFVICYHSGVIGKVIEQFPNKKVSNTSKAKHSPAKIKSKPTKQRNQKGQKTAKAGYTSSTVMGEAGKRYVKPKGKFADRPLPPTPAQYSSNMPGHSQRISSDEPIYCDFESDHFSGDYDYAVVTQTAPVRRHSQPLPPDQHIQSDSFLATYDYVGS